MISYKIFCWIEFLKMILKLNCKLIMFDVLNCWIEVKFATITSFFRQTLNKQNIEL
jgi:hypothetical protein